MNTILPSGAAPPSWSSALVNWSSHATAPTPTGFPGASTAVQQRQSGGAGAALCFAPFIATEDTRHQVSDLFFVAFCHHSATRLKQSVEESCRFRCSIMTVMLPVRTSHTQTQVWLCILFGKYLIFRRISHTGYREEC